MLGIRSGSQTESVPDTRSPRVSLLTLPAGYGTPSEPLAWEAIRERLIGALAYWFASVRPDGRPHVVARDGIWLDEQLWYGGSEDTVHTRNVRRTPHVAAHIGGGNEAVIVEGIVSHLVPEADTARALADGTMRKYPQYGRIDPASYRDGV